MFYLAISTYGRDDYLIEHKVAIDPYIVELMSSGQHTDGMLGHIADKALRHVLIMKEESERP